MKAILESFIEEYRRFKGIAILGLISALILVVVPIFIPLEKIYFAFFIFLMFIYIALTVSWNIVSGWAGQFSLGHAVFFGLGGYVAAIGLRDRVFGFFDLRAFLLSAVIAMLVAIAVGYPLLGRLRGFYFTLGTLAVSEAFRLLFINGGEFTGGAWGIKLQTTYDVSFYVYYYAAFAIMVMTVLLAIMLRGSKVGMNFVALRDDEMAAESIGINTLNYKVLAFSISAVTPALCGCLFAYYLRYVEPNIVFSPTWSLYPALMGLLGGIGSLIGAIVGSAVVGSTLQLVSLYFPAIHPLISGVLLVLVMVLLPEGVVNRLAKLLRGPPKYFKKA